MEAVLQGLEVEGAAGGGEAGREGGGSYGRGGGYIGEISRESIV